ncbi:hypothetical protein EV386_2606 [Xylanimonas ulmi]|uniref:Uncharacterized protein n=2 Tax=Xylanimonas ulmi TaxID=228973 RepID=A0A4Q7M6N9_9MICO|nr:hypothetical protein EV386_2606 [Xylanibacterium ulmi]
MTWGDAMRAWAPVAAEALEAAAAANTRLTQDDLVRTVQERSGVVTGQPHGTWLPRLLAKVDTTAGEQLSRFCLGASGSSGTRAAGTSSTRSPRARATSPRPAATRATSTRTSRSTREEPTPVFCPSCFTQLPATGVCDCQ